MPRHYRLTRRLDLKPMVEHGIECHNPAYGMLKLDEWEAQLRNSIALNTSPSVIGRLATILFVYELVHPGCIARQQSETRSKFWNRWIEYRRIWVSSAKLLVPAGGFEMPRYFFHVKRGQVTVLDQEGIDLENSAQAEEEAVRRTQQCLADDALNGMPISRGISSGMIIVADENWRRLFELLF